MPDQLNPTSNARLGQMLAKSASVLIWIADTTKACVYFNEAWLAFRGRSLEEEFGYGWAEGVHPDDYEQCLQIYLSAFDARRSFSMDYRLRHRNGTYRWIRDDGAPFFTEAGVFEGYIGTCFDIDALYQARRALEQSQQRFEWLVNAVPEVFWISAPNAARFEYVSPGFEKVWPYTVDALYASPQLFLEAVHPDDKAGYLDILTQYHAIGAPYEIEYRIRNAAGESRTIFERAYPVESPDRARVLMAGISTDVTEQKSLEARVQRMERMEALGQLAGGVAHDFNNHLAVIAGYAEGLTEALGPGALGSDAERIVQASRRAADVVRKLLAFSKVGPLRDDDVATHEILDEIADILDHSISKLITIRKDYADGPVTIRGDGSELQNVLLNLAVNARDAMPDGGTLTLGTAIATLTPGAIPSHPDAVGPHAVISVIDTGTGIAEDVMRHIFEPFFTTKEAHRGVGLGLASAHGTIERHGGFIEVDSTPGVGTRFDVYLPLAERRTLARPPVADPSPAPGTLRVLVVEDEPMIRELAARILQRAGHLVEVAVDGEDGIRRYRDAPVRPDVVVLDMMMPGVGGVAAFRAMREVDPEVRAVLCSGYAFSEEIEEAKQLGIAAIVPKPFTATQLRDAVQRVAGLADMTSASPTA